MALRTVRRLLRVDWLWWFFGALAIYGVVSVLEAPSARHASVVDSFRTSHFRRPEAMWPTVAACALQVLAAALFTWLVIGGGRMAVRWIFGSHPTIRSLTTAARDIRSEHHAAADQRRTVEDVPGAWDPDP